jgi:hypothetical protein
MRSQVQVNAVQQGFIRRLRAAGHHVHWWGPGRLATRIYFVTEWTSASVWVEFDEAARCVGPRLRVEAETADEQNDLGARYSVALEAIGQTERTVNQG